MLANLYYHYIYPGFFKVIAPVEVKLLLCIVIVAALLDIAHRIFTARNRQRTESGAGSTEHMNGSLKHMYFYGDNEQIQHRKFTSNSLHDKV